MKYFVQSFRIFYVNLTGHDIVEMNGQRVFNFQDGQGNYFAVSD